MINDRLGNPVSAGTAETLAGIDDFILGFLAYQPRAANIIAAAEGAPDN